MENFVVKSQSLTTQYEYENDDVTVNGTYNSDKTEAEVQGINGQVYRKPEGEGRGDFLTDQARFPDSGDDHVSGAREDKRDGVTKRLVENPRLIGDGPALLE